MRHSILCRFRIYSLARSITGDTFLGCTGLTSITAAADNPQYSSQDGVLFDKDAQVLCVYPGGKKGAYSIPDSVTSIGESAFEGCTGLVSVTIPDSVTSIEEAAFGNSGYVGDGTVDSSSGVHKKMTFVTIGNGVTSIGDAAFALCSLASIAIPDSITSIGELAFLSYKLTSVTIAPVKGRKWSNDAFEGNSGMNIASQSALRKAGIRGF
ncbi:MAG: leucine-rich repeat domain-containing protein [Treponematales bacterium]